jgi:ketosteroid isomerase-like protein
MSLRSIVIATLSAACWAAPCLAAEDPRVAAEIIALVRQQWDAEIAARPVSEQTIAMADDYTEFGEDYPVLFSGKALMERYSAAPFDTKTLYAEMMNPKVQVYGDTAVLTYNYLAHLKGLDGRIKPILSNSTRVYVRQSGRWMLVHSHFSRSMTPQ